jgi:hypothetical protein
MNQKRQFIDEDIKLLKQIQFESYPQLYHYLFKFAKDRFLSSIQLLGLHGEIRRQLRSIHVFDNKVYNSAYDLIASHFRYDYQRLIKPDEDLLSVEGMFPDLKDCLQTNFLMKNRADYETCLKENWIYYFEREVSFLIDNDDLITKALIVTGLGLISDLNIPKNVILYKLYCRYDCYDWYHLNTEEKRKKFKNHYDSIEKTSYNDVTVINNIIYNNLSIAKNGKSNEENRS